MARAIYPQLIDPITHLCEQNEDCGGDRITFTPSSTRVTVHDDHIQFDTQEV